MSRKQLRLEGNSIEEVLKKVEDSFGNTAHVIGAEKVRTGGIGGFFAREYVVVTVDVPEGIAYQDNGTFSAETDSIQRASGTHTDRTVVAIELPPSKGTGTQPAKVSGVKPSTSFTLPDELSQVNRRQASDIRNPKNPTGTAAAMGGLEALLAAADEADGFSSDSGESQLGQPANEYEIRGTNRTTPMYTRIREPQVPQETRALEQKPAQLTVDAKNTPRARQPFNGYTETAETPFAQPRTRASQPDVKPAVFEILMPQKHEEEPSTRTSAPVQWPAATPTARERDFDEVLRTAKALSQEASMSGIQSSANVQAQSKQPVETYKTRQDGATLLELANCGVPRRILEALPSDRTLFTLSEVMKHVPVPPKFWPEAGSIVVVLGIGTSAYSTAKIVAQQLGILERNITAAGPLSAEIGGSQLVLTAQSARELRRSARENHDTALVFLDVGHTQTDWYLAGRLLAALDPDYTMATVRAENDMTHVARALQEINDGRHIFCIAVEGVISSLTPARVLQLGIPVSYVDQMEANVIVWAAAISQALPQITWD